HFERSVLAGRSTHDAPHDARGECPSRGRNSPNGRHALVNHWHGEIGLGGPHSFWIQEIAGASDWVHDGDLRGGFPAHPPLTVAIHRGPALVVNAGAVGENLVVFRNLYG